MGAAGEFMANPLLKKYSQLMCETAEHVGPMPGWNFEWLT